MTTKGRILRTGSYAIASSVKELSPFISCTTFNILAPIYKRVNKDDCCRESDYRGFWLTRNRKILDWLLEERSSIICLQVYKILQHVESFQKEHNLSPLPVILCGALTQSSESDVILRESLSKSELCSGTAVGFHQNARCENLQESVEEED